MRLILLAAIYGGTFLTHLAWGQEQRRPNVLWICGDDHAPDVLGAYGNPQVRTPNLDRLAAQGMRFDRAYCNSPFCTASRQSFITGRYPRTIGVTQLKTPLPEKEVTLAEVLKGAGYETAVFGKTHFNSALKHGFDQLIDLPQHQQWLRSKGRSSLPRGVELQRPWKPFKDPSSIWLNSSARPAGAVDADMAGTFFAQQAASYIQTRKDQPFFLMASFYEPHSPFYFPVEYQGRHQPKVFPVPRIGPEDDRQIPKVFRDLTDSEKRGIIAAYYTSVEFLDKNIGMVLEALDKSGHAANTLVIYTGDHGYMLGQHGRFEKHCGYEPAVRSPLLVRFPARIGAQQNTEALVEFIDIFPTVLEFAGLSVSTNVQGRSLVPVLTGRTKTHREEVFIEYSENEEAYVRTDRWKFIYSTGRRLREDGYATNHPKPGRTIQLFDLQNDPDELTNLAARADCADRVADFTARLAEHMKATARQPELLPQTGDPHAVLEFCLKPKDLVPATQALPKRGFRLFSPETWWK